MAHSNDADLPGANAHAVVGEPGWTTAVAEIAPGASALRVCRFGGGAAAETFCLTTTVGEFVVKRYRRSRPDPARSEWDRLCFVQRVDVPVPRPLVLDDEGRWFGKPALAMTRLPGQIDLRPRNVDEWIRQLATALATIHNTDACDASGPLLDRSPIQTWRPPALRRPDLLAEHAIEALGRHLPDLAWQPVLTHGDPHPGNTLWQDGVLTGVADWAGARLGPAASDLAYCRAEIAILLGQGPAEDLTRYYARSTAGVPPDLPVFDLFWGLDAHRKSARIRNAHRAQGRDTTPQEIATRTTSFMRRALAQLHSARP